MRHFIFSGILVIFSYVALAVQGNYTYTGLTQITNGSDNFRLSQYASFVSSGNITVTHSSMKIDDKVFRLKPTGDGKVYRTKGGIVKFIYREKELVSIQLFRYNTVYRFQVAENPVAVR